MRITCNRNYGEKNEELFCDNSLRFTYLAVSSVCYPDDVDRDSSVGIVTC